MEQNEEFVRFVEWIPFPAWLTIPAGTLLYANQAMLKRLNSTPIHLSLFRSLCEIATAVSFVLLLEELDLIGIALFAAFLLSLMLFLMNLNHPMWSVLPIAAVFGVALIIHSELSTRLSVQHGFNGFCSRLDMANSEGFN
jgi:hypothetical protein